MTRRAVLVAADDCVGDDVCRVDRPDVVLVAADECARDDVCRIDRPDVVHAVIIVSAAPAMTASGPRIGFITVPNRYAQQKRP